MPLCSRASGAQVPTFFFSSLPAVAVTSAAGLYAAGAVSSAAPAPPWRSGSYFAMSGLPRGFALSLASMRPSSCRSRASTWARACRARHCTTGAMCESASI